MKLPQIYVFFSLIQIHSCANLANSMFTAINQKRRENGLMSLRSITNLESSAKDQALYMCENSILTHNNPSGDLQSRVKRNGFKGVLIGENIAKNHSDGFDEVIQMWMNSPLHKKNILGNYSYTGLATCLDKKGSRFWVQVFGSENDKSKKPESESDQVAVDETEPGASNNELKEKKQDSDKKKPSKLINNRMEPLEDDNEEQKPKNSRKPRKSQISTVDPSSPDPDSSVEQILSSKMPKKRKFNTESKTPHNISTMPPNLDKLQNMDLSKLGSFVSTQIIYVFSTPTAYLAPKSEIEMQERSIVPQKSYSTNSKIYTTTSIITSKVESVVTITKSETKTVSQIDFKTKTITTTETTTASPSVSIESRSITSTTSPISGREDKHSKSSTSTKTITKIIEITRSVMAESPTKEASSRQHPRTRLIRPRREIKPDFIPTPALSTNENESDDSEAVPKTKNQPATRRPRKNSQPNMFDNQEVDENQQDFTDQDNENFNDANEEPEPIQQSNDFSQTGFKESPMIPKRRFRPGNYRRNRGWKPEQFLNNPKDQKEMKNEIRESLENILRSGFNVSLNRPLKKNRKSER